MTMRRALLIALGCAIAAPPLSLAQPRPPKIPQDLLARADKVIE